MQSKVRAGTFYEVSASFNLISNICEKTILANYILPKNYIKIIGTFKKKWKLQYSRIEIKY
jgi:hypothetical protein